MGWADAKGLHWLIGWKWRQFFAREELEVFCVLLLLSTFNHADSPLSSSEGPMRK